MSKVVIRANEGEVAKGVVAPAVSLGRAELKRSVAVLADPATVHTVHCSCDMLLRKRSKTTVNVAIPNH